MNKRQQVEAAIREACPDLQELSFGCRVLYKKPYGNFEGTITGTDEEWTDSKVSLRKHGCPGMDMLTIKTLKTDLDDQVDTEENCEKYKDVYSYTYPITKIIGHPIRLSHVLRAGRLALRGERDQKDRLEDHLLLNWPLETDNLNDASEETIEFLHEVLCQ